MKSGRNLIVVLAAVAIPAALVAAVPDIIQSRQQSYKKMGASFKALNDELRQAAPAISVVRAQATTLNAAASSVTNAFPRGSGQESGIKTGAHPAIWQNAAAFRTAQGNLLAAASNLRTAAESGDLGRVRGALQRVGPTCKACHDQYRIKD